MKILFLAPTYMGLYKDILSEMMRMGHEVVFLEDVMFEWDWKSPWRGRGDRVCRRLKCICKRSFERYWEDKFAAGIGLDQQFDLLFVINGCSLHQSFFNRIQKHSSHIKKVLYLWDNSQFFDYYHYAHRFDKVLTYDIDDSVKFKAGLLPFYWKPNSSKVKEQPLLYKISMIGSNHDNRLKIAKIIASQLRAHGMNYCFKILDKSLKENDIVIHKPLSTDSV